MARDGNGNYVNPFPDFVAGTVISSTEVDANNSAIATALTQSIAVDGQSVVTGNLPMATFKHTGVSETSGQSSRTEYLAPGVVQDGKLNILGSVAGTGDVVTANASPAITAYAAGLQVALVVGSTNTTNVTININGVGAVAVEKLQLALVAGDWTAGDLVLVEHDGTQFQMISAARTPVLTADSIPGSAVAQATFEERGTSEFATSAEVTTGTDVVRTITPGALVGVTDLTNFESFLDEDNMVSDDATKVSSQQAIKAYVDAQVAGVPALTAGTDLVMNPIAINTSTAQAHGLGAAPDIFKWRLECLTADANYSVGMILDMSNWSATTSGDWFATLIVDATNVTLISANKSISIVNRTTAAVLALTPASWKLTITPYLVG